MCLSNIYQTGKKNPKICQRKSQFVNGTRKTERPHHCHEYDREVKKLWGVKIEQFTNKASILVFQSSVTYTN